MDMPQKVGLKTKTKIFDYREPFSRFYRDSGVNENENSYRKYKNKNGIFIRNWKRKWFQPLPTVFENYRIYAVIYRRYYRILEILPYLKPSPTHIFFRPNSSRASLLAQPFRLTLASKFPTPHSLTLTQWGSDRREVGSSHSIIGYWFCTLLW